MPLHKSAHICICITQMGLMSAQAPFRVFTLSKWHLACHPSTSLSKDPQNPPQVPGPPLCPRVTKAKLQGSPGSCQNCLPKSSNFPWAYGWNVMNSVTLGAPWGCLPQATRGAHASLSAVPWMGLTASLTFIITITYCLAVRDAGFIRAMGFLL